MARKIVEEQPEPANDDYEEEVDSDEELEGEDDPNNYIPPHKLEAYHWHRRNISELVEMMKTPWLELNPDYQRNVVWSADRMTRLINSLMSNYYVPPLIFNVKKRRHEGGSLRYQRICIDGKQRLSSIREFVNGRIPCLDNRKRKWWYCETDGKQKRKILSDKQKDYFRNLEMLCVEYSELELTQEEELFSRVQMGMELRPAEKLRARSGLWQAFALEIENEYPDLMAKIDNKRARAFQTILSTFRTLLSDDDNPTYTAGATSLGPFLEKTQLLDDVFKRDARLIFKKFNDVFKSHAHVFENNSYKHSSRFAPIEFVGVALLIKMYPDRSTGLLAGDISRMREFLRESRQELRSNTATFKAILEYIDKLEKYRGGQGVVSRDDHRRVEDDSGNDGDGQPPEKKPRLVNGVAVPPSKPRSAPKAKRIPIPPPVGSLGSSRRSSLAGGGSNGGAKAINASTSAAPPFAPPTAPLAFREKERGRERQLQQQQLQHQEPLSMVPVAPMSRYNLAGRNQDSNFKLRPTHFSNSANARPSSPHYSGHRQAPSPHPSNFRAINTPTAPGPFLPDLDTTDAYPSHTPHNNQRKRPRRDDEQQLSEDLDLNNQNQNQNRGNKTVNAADVVAYDTRHANGGTGYRSNNANNNANNNNHNHSGGGYRPPYPPYHTRGGSGNAGPQGRRIKQERNNGNRRDANYGFDSF